MKKKSVVFFDGGLIVLLIIIFTAVATIREEAIADRTPECKKAVQAISGK